MSTFLFYFYLTLPSFSDRSTVALNHHVSNGEARVSRSEKETRGRGRLLRIPIHLADPRTVRG